MRWKLSKSAVVISIVLILVGLGATVALYLRLPWVRTETVSFRSGEVTLVGTLALPRWRDAPYPGAVFVHGSNPSSRWMYWLYAMHLVPSGMAVLIYDKRGAGDSSGLNPQDTTVSTAECGKKFDLLARDALAGVEWLRTRTDIDHSRIGFVGVSQAGWIMPLAASRSKDVAFIVSISGPAVTCGIENQYSDLTGENSGTPNSQLSDEEIDRRLREYDGPAGFDPVPVLETLRVPILWVLGGQDRSVPTSWSVATLRRIIDGNGAPFDVRVYPDGDHLLRRGGGNGQRIDYWTEVQAWLVAREMLPEP